MKKTFNINIAGFPFIIDDDAYVLLNDYLETIEHAFAGQEDSNELVSDIESRVAELLLECSSEGSPIITAADVENVISRIGKPEEMVEEEETISINRDSVSGFSQTAETITPPPYVPPMPPVKKKLYRDTQNGMVGGVCAGFAWYLHADPTAVRLLTVLITVLSVATCSIAYLILWIVIPEANTPYERMQMMGEETTVENIGKTVTDSFREENSSQPQSDKKSNGVGSTLAGIFAVLTKVLIIIGLIVAIPILVVFAIGLIGCVFALIMFGTTWGATFFGEQMPNWYLDAGNIPVYGVLCGIGAILTFGIPLFLLVRMGIKGENHRPLTSPVRNTLLILWILGFITAAVSTGRIINLYDEQEHKAHREYTRIQETSNDYVDTPEEPASDWDSEMEKWKAENPNFGDSIPN